MPRLHQVPVLEYRYNKAATQQHHQQPHQPEPKHTTNLPDILSQTLKRQSRPSWEKTKGIRAKQHTPINDLKIFNFQSSKALDPTCSCPHPNKTFSINALKHKSELFACYRSYTGKSTVSKYSILKIHRKEWEKGKHEKAKRNNT